MELHLSVPTNRFLVRQRDRRWPRVLSSALVLAGVLLLVLLVVGWPRLKSTSIHYHLIRLRREVRQLERHERQLALELERERNPARLAQRGRDLGLQEPAVVSADLRQTTEGAP